MIFAYSQSWALSATIRQIDNEFIDRHCRLSVVDEKKKVHLSACRCRPQVCERLSRIIDDKNKYICRSVVVGLKFVTDKVDLSMKKLIGFIGLSDMTAAYMYVK